MPDPAALAALHARAMSVPPPWSPAAFAACLSDPACFTLTLPVAGATPAALLIGRVVLDEAELLTLATAPENRRQGLARQLLAAFAASARQRGAASAFLEVAEDNRAARALYAADGWTQTGRRPGYYRRPGLPPVAALLLARPLARQTQAP